ncbi:MAG TPA: bifunctional phosphoribosylaminoimidazolecarboxamide formyltransferase/IMP cyclohydrolase [Pyrinomonadaceae bacterium]|nr:bifunctional phosphoribosylaminoimidazolecarboxamide formyltransferase/IMP cyclohydrolase [Pyrinomonadaceae bacterium]
MTNQNNLRRIRRALISVSDKAGLIELANVLIQYDVEIISTGGTARALRDAGVAVRDVSEVTGFPEMMDGRIKTLHPRIHGGLLAIRDNVEHVNAMREHNINGIDLVVVNLYPFERTIAKQSATIAQAIEQIDIGGPAMIRSAAKNHNDVTVVVKPEQYERVISNLKDNNGSVSLDLRQSLAAQAFAHTSNYDAAVANYFDRTIDPSSSDKPELSDTKILQLHKLNDLRYGENPHQKAALYSLDKNNAAAGTLAYSELLSGKEMSFNNYVDAEAAWELVCDFDSPACAIIKHTNPAGVGLGATLTEAYKKALATDPVSAFGGIVAFNRRVDARAAEEVTGIFTEVVIAPDYDERALEILRTKKNLRVLQMGSTKPSYGIQYRQISGGMLLQTPDDHKISEKDLKVVTQKQPTTEEIRALLFAWIVCKHTKSNAIVYAREGQTVGVGAGQMSRVDSVKIGAMRANLPLEGSVLASDAFFPFRDGLDEAARHGITAVIQPGGSVRDTEVIAAANELGLAMVFTGIRHFKH